MATINDNIIIAPNLTSAAAQVMVHARKTIAPDYLPYLIDDAVEVTAILADNNHQDYQWNADEGGCWSVAFHCTDTGVYSYVFVDSAMKARKETPASLLVTVKHWQERDGWQVTIR